jgi:3-hydroxymyristoyl/3-hydroxydecanoyl-(acyl carrier protein) dehydratase
MMGQAAAMCLNSEDPEKGRGRAVLAQIRSASFRDWVRPDERISIRAEIRTNRAELATAVCSAEVRGNKVSTSDLLFTFLPKERFAADDRDEVLESFLNSHGRVKDGPHG